MHKPNTNRSVSRVASLLRALLIATSAHALERPQNAGAPSTAQLSRPRESPGCAVARRLPSVTPRTNSRRHSPVVT